MDGIKTGKEKAGTKGRVDKFPIQNIFLDRIIKDSVLVTVYTVKGIAITCKIIGQDQYTLLLDVKGQQQLIHKGGISTITPSKKIIQ